MRQAPTHSAPEAPPPLAILVKGWPRLSETFIAQELLALQQAGLRFRIVSLRHPTDSRRHPIHDQITAPVLYLPEYLHQEPRRVLRGLAHARGRPGWRRAMAAFERDLARDTTRNRVRRLGQAAVLVREALDGVRLLYAHFMHTPGSVARYASLITGVPFALSAHARDIWTIADWDKREKLADAAWLTTCTGDGARHLAALAPAPERVQLLYHGLDLSRFAPPPPAARARDPQAPVQILSVGRLVAKKGYDLVLEALARLPAGLSWRFTHIGGGPLSAPLAARAEALGLASRITWAGAQAQEAVLAACRAADLFVLASRIDGDGDRDGLPNVLMEAQSQQVACIATAISAIPELIQDGTTGLLVPPEDPDALAEALARAIADPALRARLGAAGEARVRAEFDLDRQVAPLIARLRTSVGGTAAQEDAHASA